ncbi:hypothetical protein ACP70R_047799 [Stipagrostis hirtigluma subsp. patula]
MEQTGGQKGAPGGGGGGGGGGSSGAGGSGSRKAGGGGGSRRGRDQPHCSGGASAAAEEEGGDGVKGKDGGAGGGGGSSRGVKNQLGAPSTESSGILHTRAPVLARATREFYGLESRWDNNSSEEQMAYVSFGAPFVVLQHNGLAAIS